MQIRKTNRRTWSKGKKRFRRENEGCGIGDIENEFTGKHDYQGKRIYEHDIVCIRNLIEPSDVKYIIVDWDYKRMGWNLGKHLKPMHSILVVGNAYQHRNKIQGVKL